MTISHLYFDHDHNTWRIQTNDEHQAGVATLAEEFGSDLGLGDICRVMGQIHDLGKEQQSFQNHIKKQSGYDTSIRCDEHPLHAYVGALAVRQQFGDTDYLAYLMSAIISAHHSGLKDIGIGYYKGIMSKEIPSDVKIPNISHPKINIRIDSSETHHLIRMLYSCLVDADFLDTETFMNGGISRHKVIGDQKSIPELLAILEQHLSKFDVEPKSELNKIRTNIQCLCRDHGKSPQGIYSLTVPTGGGKTLSGLLWALRHASEHGLKRVIVAIPYTSIIVQTAQILRDIFGDNNVLEHHSAFDADEIDADDEQFTMKQHLASENWDYPIIVTTNVQLFQSMMASKPSRCRKLHNIKNSVIILDEAQMLPLEHLQPIIDTLSTYQRLFRCSILLTTASQPVLEHKYIHEATNKLHGLDNVTEIIPPELKLHDKLRRVRLNFIDEQLDYDSVAKQMMKFNQVLCIVNTRRDALEIFSRLPIDTGRHFHLSRMMCSEHLAETIREIRQALFDGSDEPIRVVATQLIEAGVDVDFETVMRQEAGLDSILQAAGRCNREGRHEIGDTYVFKLDRPLPPGFISNANNARISIPESLCQDWFSPETMREYFRQLYSRNDNFDKANVKDKTNNPIGIQFETLAKEFRLIEDNGVSVIVNYKDSQRLIELMNRGGITYPLKKKLSRFTVNIHQRDFKELKDSGIIQEILPEIYYIPDSRQYDSQTGLSVENHWLNEIQII